ncbi:uncharacterized protein LOC113312458 [Papaver somniferum]|uniref:uncharacterized protein LOC113312458 n=1 Tax=Papaver somniferum TaxID=3469 RepID=UPI000E6FAF59|nr:uncharacterized protein LOC113312458 [Papaver somniferum]
MADMKEMFWRDKLRIQWNEEGDRNTMFVHRIAKVKRSRNTFSCLKIISVDVVDKLVIKNKIFEHFFDRFKSFELTQIPLTNMNFKSISSEDATWLERPISEEEVFVAFKLLGQKRAPGFSVITFFEDICGTFASSRTGILPDKFCCCPDTPPILDSENGFRPCLVNLDPWIPGCISKVTFSILINGSSFRKFTSEKGLRQGDPLSPFLFLLVSEVLTMLFDKAKETGILGGFLSSGSSTTVKTNFSKSSLFGVGDVNDLEDLAEILKFSCSCFPTSYLGMPLGGKTNTASKWDKILEICRTRLYSWKRKSLTKEGVTIWVSVHIFLCFAFVLEDFLCFARVLVAESVRS